MRSLAVTMLVVLAATFGLAADTPAAGRLVEGVACASDPSQTYTLYLPTGYDASVRWPVLVVMDPRGRSVLAAELFREAAAELGWIVVSSDGTRSDTGMEPNRRAINALWPEIHDHYAIDPRRIYLAGFSGTVSVAFLIEHETRQIAGIIGAGGRFFEDELDGERAVVFGAAGDTDFNYQEMRALHAFLADHDVPNRLEIFEGGHSWMPPEVAHQAVEWMELQAMRRSLRDRNDALVERFYREDLEAARRLEGDGRTLEAMRRYAAIAADYQGLHEVEEAARRADALEHDREVVRALKDERSWNAFERRYLQQMNAAVDELVGSDSPPPPGRLEHELEIDALKRRAERPGIEGVTARRLLGHVFTTTSFYLTRDLLGQGRPAHAAAALEVASEIRPDDRVVWYNLGCALALAGRRDASLEALERAVAVGFSDAPLLASDPDLNSVRGTDRYRALAAAIGATAGENPAGADDID